MHKYPKNHKGVEYYIPGRNRRIAGSTKAVSDFLALVHVENSEKTIQQLRELITDRFQYMFDPEAVGVLDAYIKAGYGEYVPEWK